MLTADFTFTLIQEPGFDPCDACMGDDARALTMTRESGKLSIWYLCDGCRGDLFRLLRHHDEYD